MRFSEHIKRLLILGIPIAIAQIIQQAIHVTDALMVARLGALPLAQMTLGAQTVIFIELVFVGFFVANSIEFTPALAKEDWHYVKKVFQMGLWQALLFFIISLVFCFNSAPILRALGQEEAVIEGAALYVLAAGFSLLPIYLASVFRNFFLSRERMITLLAVSVCVFLLNILLNAILIYGWGVIPAFGLLGSAYATIIVSILFCVIMMILTFRDEVGKRLKLFHNFFEFHAQAFGRLIALGIPVSFGIISEVSLFQAMTIMAGWISVDALAAQGLVLQIASIAFMLPLGLAMATSIRVGNALGRENVQDIHYAAMAGLLVSSLIMCLTAGLFLSFPAAVLGLLVDVNSEEFITIIPLAVGYLVVVGAFQIFDGAQAVAISSLRGMKDATWPAVIAFIGYWPVGMSAAYYFGFVYGLGGVGIWMGAAMGLIFVSLVLWSRYAFITLPKIRARFAA